LLTALVRQSIAIFWPGSMGIGEGAIKVGANTGEAIPGQDISQIG
jgi:hypothetical protein